jgi:hypothetical protein
MVRRLLVAALACGLAATAGAQPRPPAPRRLLDAPVFTIRPLGALSAFVGEGVEVVIAWRPVGEAARYRVTLTTADGKATDVEIAALRFEKHDLAPGRYQLTVTAIDASGTEGAISEALPLNVVEIRAVPPGADKPMPPTRGAYAVGTKFSVAGMHCEITAAQIDDLLVLPENELRITTPGRALLRCAGILGYLEKEVVIAPISVALQSPTMTRGETTTLHVTLGSVAHIGSHIDVQAFGDITVGEAVRTEYGVDVPVAAPPAAKTGALALHTGNFELGRFDLALVAAPPPPPQPPPAPIDWAALDFGGQVGAFFPPSEVTHATRIGKPTDPDDVVTGGALAGVRVGFFPTRRVGLEGEISILAGGYANESGVSQLLATRGQLAVRAFERGRFGVRLFAGAGAWTTLVDRDTSRQSAEAEVHGGAALTVETSPNLWLRFQLADLVTAARDSGYAHVLEPQLGIFTRFGRRDSF